MKIGEIFRKAYSMLYPETPPNYPIQFLWDKNNGIPTKKILDIWLSSNTKHKEKSHVIYIHIPYCPSICKFCGFYREKLSSFDEIDTFLKKLFIEISLIKPPFLNTKIKWVCVGGGTPSILNEYQITNLFEKLRENFNLNGTKIAFEALPSTLTLTKLRVLKENGIDFLAIGVQSFNEALLKNLNRNQTKKQAVEAITNARKAGFKNIEVELMLGLPGQTEEIFLKDIEILSKLDVERIYIFEFQPRFFTHTENVDSSLDYFSLERLRDIRKKGIEILLKNGYKMISGRAVFKRSGKSWPYSYDQQEDELYSIVGLGPSAISYCLDRMRYQNYTNLNEYLKTLDKNQLPIERIKFLSQKDEMKNMFMVKILQTGKIDDYSFKKRFGKSLAECFQKEIELLEKANLIVRTKNSIISTNSLKLQDALNELFYSKSQLKKIAHNLNLYPDKIEREEITSNKIILDYDTKILDISFQNKNLSYHIALRKKFGYKDVVLNFLKGSLTTLKFYYYLAKKNNLEVSIILPIEKYNEDLQKLNWKEIYFFIKELGLLKKTKSENKPCKFLIPYTHLEKFLTNNLPISKNSHLIFSHIGENNQKKLNYSTLKKLLPKIMEISKEKRVKISLDSIPYCIIYPHTELFFAFKDFKLGDTRESNTTNIKLPQCGDCKYFSQCPGPLLDFSENNEKEIKAIF